MRAYFEYIDRQESNFASMPSADYSESEAGHAFLCALRFALESISRAEKLRCRHAGYFLAFTGTLRFHDKYIRLSATFRFMVITSLIILRRILADFRFQHAAKVPWP